MRFFILPILDGVIMNGYPIFKSWWMPAYPHLKMLILCPDAKRGTIDLRNSDIINDKYSMPSHLFSCIISHTPINSISDVQ